MTDITLHLQSYNLDSDSPFTTIKYFVQVLFFRGMSPPNANYLGVYL